MNRRRFLEGCLSATAAAALGSAAPAEVSGATNTNVPQPLSPDSPNILIFMPDQQNGATVLSESPVLKPNLDSFRRQAITFRNAHCPAPHCCPSRASFLTGLYPSEHGVFNNVTTDTAIHPNPFPGVQYWSSWLKDAGYNMGYAGKLHVGRTVTPETCGFQNLSHLEQDSLQANEGRRKMMWTRSRAEKTVPSSRMPGEILRPDWTNLQLYRTLPNGGPKGYEGLPDYKIVQAGVTGMQSFAAAGKPWCLMVSNSGAHDPYDAPQRFVDMYDLDHIEIPASFRDTMDDKPRIYQRQRYQTWSQLSNTETRDCLRHYYAKCTMQDAMFGELLTALDATGQRENTIVIYVSDHGDYAAAHGLWMKGVPSFREAYHIPAIVSWPKMQREPGRTMDAFVDQVDWAPTILEACGVAPRAELSGASLLPWLRGETPAAWRTATCTQMNGVELYYTQRIVMTHEWKYVYNGFDYDELYDLRRDPHEMVNLAFPDLARKKATVLSGEGLSRDASLPWPPLAGDLETARRALLETMWTFAAKHADIIFNPYGTVALAPLGPGIGAEPVRLPPQP
ncbi:MAG TPA: sulfatase-like hydrolase/transferase [Acidobacteriaceae bacterium]|nr:sulfatase-like hydrolase/transferase [Acidobacteriaceae bacterium]